MWVCVWGGGGGGGLYMTCMDGELVWVLDYADLTIYVWV